MKETRCCPKCDTRKIWMIEKVETKDSSVMVGGGDALRVAVGRRSRPTKDKSSFWSGDGSEIYDAGFYDAYICAGCGYTEFYARELQDLVHNPDQGVHFIDSDEGVAYR